MPDKLYGIDAAAHKLEISSRTLRRYVEQGKFPELQKLETGLYVFRDQDIADFCNRYVDPRKLDGKRVYLKSNVQAKKKRPYNRRKVKGKK